MKISVVVPVYKQPKRVADIARKILADAWGDKEMIILVDGDTNPEIEFALGPVRGGAKIMYNGRQLGKAATINHFALSHETDVFLFLDNDIMLPDDTQFLTRLSKQMEDRDLAEIPKEAIAKSVIGRMMSFEFLTNAMLSLTMASCSGTSPSMNGAAFAVRSSLFRELGGFAPVINEDMDFAARAFERNARFGFPKGLRVGNEVPSNGQEWLVQRKRWALNNILWLRDYGILLLKKLPQTPALLLSTLFVLLPFVMNFGVFFAAKQTHLSLIVPLLFYASEHLRVLSGIMMHHPNFAILSVSGWLSSFVGMIVAGVVFFVFARKLRFRFSLFDFILFYLIYSPIWMVSNVIMFIAVLFKADVRVEWKVVKE
jgi:cellulose synthase/poly-beta-1,6-N-acetylglucosamine synthase-like glycosyltransferase